MAFANYPPGLSPVQNRAGNPWNQTSNLYYIAQTDTNQYALGDIVKLATGSDIDGVPQVTKTATPATDVPVGVIVGIRVADPPGLSLQGPDLTLALIQIPATKTRGYYVYVVDDPDVIFEAPTDLVTISNLVNSTTNPTSLIAANKNASYIINNPTGSSPFSGTVISTATIATTSTLPLKIMGMNVKPDNLLSNVTIGVPLRLRVMFNVHAYLGNQAGV
jgi:hypothetical protein